jgi:hypothetical protein
MLNISQAQFDAMAALAEHNYVERVRRFLESDYPEAAGLDMETGKRNAIALIKKAQEYGLTSQENVLRFISMLLDYFVHNRQAYAWAHELLSAPDITEDQKMRYLEHRLYGAPLWD